MSWTHFLLWLGAAYMLYYSLNLLYDRLGYNQSPTRQPEEALLYYNLEEPTLVSEHLPKQPSAESTNPENTADYLPSGTTGSSGAVSLQDIVDLARDELIEYKKKIPY